MGVEAVQLYLLLLTILNCGATCSDIVNDFQCDCPLGYTGDTYTVFFYISKCS